MRMSHSDEPEGLKREEPKSTFVCVFVRVCVHVCVYAGTQACHYLSEVTAKDSMIYQTCRQAPSPELLLDGTERCKGE